MKARLLRLWIRLQHEESGQDLIEYALLVALIALVVFSVAPNIATAITGVFTRASTCLNTGAGCAAAPAP